MLTTQVKFGEVFSLEDRIGYNDEKVTFEQLMETKHGGVNLVAFKAGQKLDKHVAPADVVFYIIEGEIQLNILDKSHTLRKGESLMMGKEVPHSVEANQDSKVMLIKIKG